MLNLNDYVIKMEMGFNVKGFLAMVENTITKEAYCSLVESVKIGTEVVITSGCIRYDGVDYITNEPMVVPTHKLTVKLR